MRPYLLIVTACLLIVTTSCVKQSDGILSAKSGSEHRAHKKNCKKEFGYFEIFDLVDKASSHPKSPNRLTEIPLKTLLEWIDKSRNTYGEKYSMVTFLARYYTHFGADKKRAVDLYYYAHKYNWVEYELISSLESKGYKKNLTRKEIATLYKYELEEEIIVEEDMR